MAVTCTRCPGLLVDHCTSPTCTWMRCTNAGCEAHTFDVSRGLLRLQTGLVLDWADDTTGHDDQP